MRQAACGVPHVMRAATLATISASFTGSSDSETERMTQTTKPTCDHATGKCKGLTYDANQNGIIDTADASRTGALLTAGEHVNKDALIETAPDAPGTYTKQVRVK